MNTRHGLPGWLLFCLLLAGVLQAVPVAAADAAERAGLYLRLDDKNGTCLASFPFSEGQVFGIRYIHSVARSPVEDWFSVTDGCIYLEKTIYQDFGAGLPHKPEGGQRMYTENGHVIISGFHRRLPRFDLRVGRIAQHTLILPLSDGSRREVPLREIAPPGSALTFYIEECR